ncbi:metalloregulator ArsR/SmtB family transcription factor [Hydrogenibacillus sp. N12]|uniref:ArsR/SmtB family transcription factor n=1 Tax=Hydrogenibacillus sp. N12 TaxID=2866627 RepID=UPI001C7D1DE5|nr:metalloregulator ArsR/SmtB family transcription factor [Hydrogenibacillus sp. N12]QZA32741.1 metalloregulator ArsR/SmtB family transcription factor [Hydrogenibacillus sp. N12]
MKQRWSGSGSEAKGLETSAVGPEAEAVAVFKALGHEARYRILQLLLERRQFCGDLVAELGLAQSTVSHHLKILREAGLVVTEERGPWVCYEVDVRRLRSVLAGLLFQLDGADPPAAGAPDEN